MTCHSCGQGTRLTKTKIRGTVTKQEEEKRSTQVMPWTSLPLFDCPQLPEDLDAIVGSSEEGKAWRMPIERLMPGGNLNPYTYKVPKGASNIEIPRGQVVPVYAPVAGQPLEKAIASAGKTAQAVIVGSTEKEYVIQMFGFITFPRTHQYVVGKTYYLSKDKAGEVVSVKPSPLTQPLFTVIDQITIALNVGAL